MSGTGERPPARKGTGMNGKSQKGELVRLPGEYGTVLCCSGALTGSLVSDLRQELAMFELLGHRVIMLDLCHCTEIDGETAELLVQVARHWRACGRYLVVVAGRDDVQTQLQLYGVWRTVPSFPTEEAALVALRRGGPQPAVPASWQEARAETLALWRQARRLLAVGDDAAVERVLTSFAGLCRKAEAARRVDGDDPEHRCRYCPLFQALGGRKEDIGCRSLINPILYALSIGGEEAARVQLEHAVRMLSEMPLPGEGKVGGIEVTAAV